MNFEDRPIAFTDLATTGLEKFRKQDPAIDHLTPWHEICEIGLVLANPRTLEIIDTWSTKVKIQYPHRMSPQAQDLNGYNEADWRNAMELLPALEEYSRRTKEAVFTAHNSTFDCWGFLEIAFTANYIEHKLDFHRICVLNKSRTILEVKGYPLPPYQLDDVAELLKLGRESLPHRALNGAMKAYEVYKEVQNLPFSKSTHTQVSRCIQ